MEAAVEGVDLMRSERGTEEDEDDGDDWGAECDGEDERENARLFAYQSIQKNMERKSCATTYHQFGTDSSVSSGRLSLLFSTLS